MANVKVISKSQISEILRQLGLGKASDEVLSAAERMNQDAEISGVSTKTVDGKQVAETETVVTETDKDTHEVKSSQDYSEISEVVSKMVVKISAIEETLKSLDGIGSTVKSITDRQAEQEKTLGTVIESHEAISELLVHLKTATQNGVPIGVVVEKTTDDQSKIVKSEKDVIEKAYGNSRVKMVQTDFGLQAVGE